MKRAEDFDRNIERYKGKLERGDQDLSRFGYYKS